MAIYPYTLPALLAFISKIAILLLSLRAERHNFQTRLFIAALLGSMVINIAEIAVLQKLLVPEHAVTLHYTAHILVLALLAHLAISVSFDNLPKKLLSTAGIAIYGYVLMLEGLLIFTSALVAGVEPLGNYTYARVPGTLYWLYEFFVVASMVAITAFPILGLRSDREPTARNRCKLWVILSTPLAILILTILVLLHLGFRWFNATVTTPLLIALFLAAVGYAVHHHRPIDLNFYLPWSRLKKFKTRLYAQLVGFGRAIPRFRTIEQLLDRLATILGCPVALFGPRAPIYGTPADSPLMRFPLPTLLNISHMTVAGEIRESRPLLYVLMAQHGIATIVPFFSHSRTARHWLLLGDPFSHSIYTPQDFRQIERLFERIAGLLLDKLMQPDLRHISAEAMQSPKSAATRLKKPLPESVAEFEAGLIRQALTSCHGNQARAARLLGIQPNTLHYKIERYGLSAPSTG